ncbi:uncharacterized protein EKO05_0004953 [Ascochyta rabiei]|uniref:Uncharacterized protein n=1 Tax=Didymella rabiei TaxID=5454 RepID=A0A163KKY3_DIDRA|nr:uncharacterized protein EKO05_0004953 [Ascochyta rabiei]KZM27072.1 hypothetical protein ST47_g1853 [Ascochyta rabiei]UPX14473.1 hypothetical protein EKO05_0004953 [Ascochyta rabiei]
MTPDSTPHNTRTALPPPTKQPHTPTTDHTPTKLRRLLSLAARGRRQASPLKKQRKKQQPPKKPKKPVSPTTAVPADTPMAETTLSSARTHGDAPAWPLEREVRESGCLEYAHAHAHAHGQGQGQGQEQRHVLVTEDSGVFRFPLPPSAAREETVECGCELLSVPDEAGQAGQGQGQGQLRKDSVVRSSHQVFVSQCRNAALTSHPVGGSEEGFLTPGEVVGER